MWAYARQPATSHSLEAHVAARSLPGARTACRTLHGLSCSRRHIVARASPWGSDLSQSPFSEVDRQFAEVDRQFANMERQFTQMERQMDRDFANIFGRTSSLVERQRQQMQQLQDQALQQSQQQQQQFDRRFERSVGPNIRIEQQEESSSGAFYRSYRFHQSIQINGNGAYMYSTPTPVQAPIHPLVLVAALLASAHAFVSAIFVKNYHLTTYSPRWRWLLTLLWPLLAAFNKPFRQQLAAVLQGKRPKLSNPEGEETAA